MSIIPAYYHAITQGTKRVYEPVTVVPPLLQWLVRRIEQRSQFITGEGSPGIHLGCITHEVFNRLYMGRVSLDWDPLHTTTTLKNGRDIFSLWVNIAPKERVNATLKKLGVDRAGFYRFHFDTCFWANKMNVNVWGVYVPHIDNERTLQPVATWGGLTQRYIEYAPAPVDIIRWNNRTTKPLGGPNE
jgi:hypothetical protein